MLPSDNWPLTLLANLYRSAKNLKPNVLTSEMFLFRSGGWQICSIIGAYLLFTLVIGPKMMANRKPFELRRTIQVYNIFMVGLNLYFFFASIVAYGVRNSSAKLQVSFKRDQRSVT